MRRTFGPLTGFALMAAAIASPAFGQAYPTQDIRIISAFPPGSGSDIITRHFAEHLRSRMGRTIIVENKVGAAGNIGAEYVARAKPDGHTILIHAASSIAANYHLFKNPPINPSKDLTIVSTINLQPFMITVPYGAPYKTVAELTEAMKKKGSTATYAQSNTTARVMGELYKKATGVTAVEVPYRTGNDSINDFAGGKLDFGMTDPAFAVLQEEKKLLRSLAVSTSKRMSTLPHLPTLMEEGIPIEIANWFAALVPAGTPRPVILQLNAWINEVVALPETAKLLTSFGGIPWVTTADEGQAAFVKSQNDWEGYVEAAKIEKQ
jgi:tripartite-type tricarboxylate transporter receptor subunit TctC